MQSSVIVVDSDGPQNTDTDVTEPETSTVTEAVQHDVNQDTNEVVQTEKLGESEVESAIESSPQAKTVDNTTSAKDTSMHIYLFNKLASLNLHTHTHTNVYIYIFFYSHSFYIFYGDSFKWGGITRNG